MGAECGVVVMGLVTIKDLEVELGTIPPDRAQSAEKACKRASDAVLGHLRTTEAALVALAAATEGDRQRVESVKGIAMGVAIDVFTNPKDRANYSGPEGLAWSGTPRARRTLFGSEKDALDNLWIGGFA